MHQPKLYDASAGNSGAPRVGQVSSCEPPTWRTPDKASELARSVLNVRRGPLCKWMLLWRNKEARHRNSRVRARRILLSIGINSIVSDIIYRGGNWITTGGNCFGASRLTLSYSSLFLFMTSNTLVVYEIYRDYPRYGCFAYSASQCAWAHDESMIRLLHHRYISRSQELIPACRRGHTMPNIH